MQKNKVLIICPICIREIKDRSQNLIASLKKIKKTGIAPLTYICVQKTNRNRIFKKSGNIKQYVKWGNVSRARNLGLKYAKKIRATHIIFHDSGISWTRNAARFLKKNLNSNYILHFKKSNKLYNIKKLKKKKYLKKLNPCYDHYIWTFCFPFSKIKNARFNELFGLGDSTKIKSGEDLLFLLQQDIYSSPVLTDNNAIIKKVNRDNIIKKDLKYSFGIGFFTAYLFCNKFKIQACAYFIKFCANNMLKGVFLNKKYFVVLQKRIQGICDYFILKNKLFEN